MSPAICSYGVRLTAPMSKSSSLARAAITLVASVSAGPPVGGLYLKPPSRGGLCDGVTTMPSACAPNLSLKRMMARDTAGVGVYSSSRSASTSTPLACSTSRAVFHAGSDSAWVSLPMNSGPVVPCEARYSTIACVVAAMWASLKAVSREEPRWPEVPKTTISSGFDGSGVLS